jgi:hypothetical protein
MRKILLLSVLLVVLVAGCSQEPTGQFLANQINLRECATNWTCSDWSSCIRTGTDSAIQNRTCTDVNNCNNDTGKPTESRICGIPKIAAKEPIQMALETADLSNDKNWTVMENNIRSVDEATQIERDLGFKKGYYIHYFSQYKENESIGFVHVYHFISIYTLVDSAINMSYSFDTAKDNYKVGNFYENSSNKILSLSELADPFIGDFSIGYNATVASDVTGFKENIYTIAFTKWDVAEVVKVEGTDVTYDFLKEIVKKAEAKIA